MKMIWILSQLIVTNVVVTSDNCPDQFQELKTSVVVKGVFHYQSWYDLSLQSCCLSATAFLIKLMQVGILKGSLSCIKRTTLVIIFWQLTVFQYKFKSPQVKQSLISRNAEFAYELPNFFRFITLGNEEILEKSQNWVGAELSAQVCLQKWRFDNSGKNWSKCRYQSFLFLSNFLNFCQIFCPALQVALYQQIRVISWVKFVLVGLSWGRNVFQLALSELKQQSNR